MKLTIRKASGFVCVALFYALLMAGCNTAQSVTAGRITHERVGYSQNSYQKSTNIVQVKGSDSAEMLNEYKVTMQSIKEIAKGLKQDKLKTFSAIEMITSGNPRNGYDEGIRIIRERIDLHNILLDKIEFAEGKYADIARTYPAEWNHQIKLVANDLGNELDDALIDLNREVKKFEKIFDTNDFDVFDYMARDKTELLSAIRNQHIEMDPEIPLFKQMKAAIRLGKNVDETQLIFLVYAVCVLDKQQERQELEKTMSDLNMVSFLGILQDQRIDAGNISTALDFTFAESISPSMPVSSPVSPGILKVGIKPDRGRGGVYYEGEKITFKIEASYDCYYILRAINSEGKITQLCPNEYFSDQNFIRANVPLDIPADFMGFDFNAAAPYGIDKVEIIASRNRIKYDPAIDKLDLGRSRGPSEKTDDLMTRGIIVNKRHKALLLGGSYDEQYCASGDDGNAVIIRTFVRVLPKQI
jgi:hypothetical protein